MPKTVLDPRSVAYCVGAGTDISFDLELLRHGCLVRTVDPTPQSIAMISGLTIDDSRFAFAPYALWTESKTLRFYTPSDPSHVSHSIVNLQKTNSYIEVDALSIHDLLEFFGDTTPDLIKIDIEGAELEVLPELLRLHPKPAAICVEFDGHEQHDRVLSLVAAARSVGYKPIKAEGYNVLFYHSGAVT